MTALLSILLTLCTVVLLLFVVASQRERLLDQMALSTLRLTETVKRGVRHDMLTRNQEGIRESIDAIGRQEGIERIRIFRKAGDIVISSDKTEIGRSVDKKAEGCARCHASAPSLTWVGRRERTRIFAGEGGRRSLAVMDAIYNEPSCWNASCHAHPRGRKVLGVLDIAASLQETERDLAAATRTAVLLAAFFIIGICGLVACLIHVFVTRPTRRLLAATRRVAGGELNEPIAASGADELGELTTAFNDMRERLRFHIAKVMETQEQLLHTEKLASLGKMAAGVAHELNSPLTVILNDSSLLLKDMPDGAPGKEDLKVIVSEAKRCGGIIHNLLAFTRFRKPETILADAGDVLRETLALVRHQAGLHDVELRTDLAAGLPKVRLDCNQIKQVFLDIIINAVHAMPEGGTLTVRTSVDGNGRSVRIAFQDTGCGIPEENLEKIFQPFFTTKDADRGTGLGLAICYDIAQRHGGGIEVSSVVGRGSIFTVVLPAAEAEQRSLPSQERGHAKTEQ